MHAMYAQPTLIALGSALYLVSMMFALGLRVGAEPKESKERKRRKRKQLVVGLILNLVLIPAVAFGATRALHAPPSHVATALLLLVAAPGGRFAPHVVQLGRGDVALAAEVAIFLAKITGFTAAPVAKFMLDLKALELRELPLVVQLLLLQLVPYYGGRWLGRKRVSLADRLRKGANRVALAMLLVSVVLVILEDRGIRSEFHDRAWFAVLGVSLAAPVLGWLVGGRDEDARRTFSIGANASELALALMMANLVFPERGVHLALFGIWTVRSLASVLLAAGFRGAGVTTAAPGHSIRT
jgi:BASS family bile acid:Na+ symporter